MSRIGSDVGQSKAAQLRAQNRQPLSPLFGQQPQQQLGVQPQWVQQWNPWGANAGANFRSGQNALASVVNSNTAADASNYNSDNSYFASLYGADASVANTNIAANASQNSSYFPAYASVQNANTAAGASNYGVDRGLEGLLAQLPWNFAGQQLAANTQRDTTGMNAFAQLMSAFYPSQASIYNADTSAGLGRYQADTTAGLGRYQADTTAGLGRYQADSTAGLGRYQADAGLQQANVGALANIFGSGADLQGILAQLPWNYAGQQLAANVALDANDVQRNSADVGALANILSAFFPSQASIQNTETTAGLGRYQTDADLQKAFFQAMIPSQTQLSLAQMEGQRRDAGLQQMLELIGPMLARSGQQPQLPNITTNYGAGITSS